MVPWSVKIMELSRTSVIVPVVVVAVLMAVLVATMALASMSHHDEHAIHELHVHV